MEVLVLKSLQVCWEGWGLGVGDAERSWAMGGEDCDGGTGTEVIIGLLGWVGVGGWMGVGCGE